jgi:hypothetical protein
MDGATLQILIMGAFLFAFLGVVNLIAKRQEQQEKDKS